MEDQLRELFGMPARINRIKAPTGLPIYMTENRKFYNAEISDVQFVIVQIPDLDRFSVTALEKQLAKYIDATGLNAAYSITALTKIQRDSMVSRKIPFISIPTQIYLPFLGVALSNRFARKTVLKVDRFSPAAQTLFLYFLYNSDKKSVLKKDAAKALGLTKMSVTRASEQLLALGLLNETPVGREVHMAPTASGKAYYEMGCPYMIDPAIKTVTVIKQDCFDKYPLAGESALAERTMLNEPPVSSIAVWKKDLLIEKLDVVDEKWETAGPLVKVEIWKYNPVLFATNGVIDPASMAASLADTNDERVEGELNEYMEALKW